MPTNKRLLLVTHPLRRRAFASRGSSGAVREPFPDLGRHELGLIGSIFWLWWAVIGAVLSIPIAFLWYWTEEDQ
jgi:hypothetical protein